MIGGSNAKHMKVLAQNGAMLHIITDNNRNGYAPDITISLYKDNVLVRQIDVNSEFRLYYDRTYESDNESDYIYEITPANYGTWSVVASSGGFSKTKTVTVDSAKEYIVPIRMSWWFQSGFGECFMANGSNGLTTETQTNAWVGVGTDYIEITMWAEGNNCSSVYSKPWFINHQHHHSFFNPNRFLYTEVVFDIEVIDVSSEYPGYYYPRLLVTDTWPTNGAEYSADTYAVRYQLEQGDRTTISLDVSNVTGLMYTGVTGQCDLKIYNMYWA